MSSRYNGVQPIEHRGMEREIDSYLADQERADSRSEAVRAKVQELMEDRSEIASALDDIMGFSDVGSDGNTLFAADMAVVLLASQDAFNAECVRYFIQLRERLESYMQDPAALLVNEQEQTSAADHEEAVAAAREDARQQREEFGGR